MLASGGEVKVQGDNAGRHEKQQRGHAADARHPSREWAAHVFLHAGPAAENEQSPETNLRKLIAVHRVTCDLRHEIVTEAESNGREEEQDQGVDVPGIDSRAES